MNEWKKMFIEATNHRYIVGIYMKFDEDDEPKQNMNILHFNGIHNRWRVVNGTIQDLMMKDILWYIPLPEIPKQPRH